MILYVNKNTVNHELTVKLGCVQVSYNTTVGRETVEVSAAGSKGIFVGVMIVVVIS